MGFSRSGRLFSALYVSSVYILAKNDRHISHGGNGPGPELMEYDFQLTFQQNFVSFKIIFIFFVSFYLDQFQRPSGVFLLTRYNWSYS